MVTTVMMLDDWSGTQECHTFHSVKLLMTAHPDLKSTWNLAFHLQDICSTQEDHFYYRIGEIHKDV